MKRISLCVAILVLLSKSFVLAQEVRQVPKLVNYQGKLTDAKGDPPANGEYTLEFNLYDNATTGTLVWGPQVFTKVPVVDGQFNVILGPTDNSAGKRPLIDAFRSDNRFLGIKVNSGVEIQPRQQILSTPFAFEANYAKSGEWAARAWYIREGHLPAFVVTDCSVNGNTNATCTQCCQDLNATCMLNCNNDPSGGSNVCLCYQNW